jgi:hypothetical protein
MEVATAFACGALDGIKKPDGADAETKNRKNHDEKTIQTKA